MKFDDILIDHVGEFGRYQKLIVLIISLTSIVAVFNGIDIVFAGATPKYWCEPPANVRGLQNLTREELFNLTSPLITETDGTLSYDVCQQYDYSGNGNLTYTHVLEDEDAGDANATFGRSINRQVNIPRTIHKCQTWIYDKSQYLSTTVTQVSIIQIWMRSLMDLRPILR